MKFSRFLIPFVIFILSWTACSDADDEPAVLSSEWEFQVTFNITDPDAYSFDAEGTATTEYSETAYAIIADYSIGEVEFNDVIIEGAVNNDVWDFTDQYVEVEFQNGDIEYTEYINFSIPAISMDGGTASGTGTITIENGESGAVESGTFTFTATEVAK